MDASIVQMIGSLGFPIVACIWFMVKFDKTMKENTMALIELKMTIAGKGEKS